MYGCRHMKWNTACDCSPQGTRRNRLSTMQAAILSGYAHHVLPLDRVGAERAAGFRANARRSGHPVDMADALVAGIARAHALAVATRNVADFERLDVEVFNPWEAP